MACALVADDFQYAAFGCEIAFQDDQSARWFDGVGERTDDRLPRCFLRGASFVANRAARDGDLVGVEESCIEQALRHDRRATGGIDVGSDEFATRLQVAEQGSFRADAVKIIN